MTADELREHPGYLTPVIYHTLLVLSREPLHGYAVSQEVERLSDGRIRMGPGTLYGTLQRLRDSGWLDDADDVEARGAHADRRRYYRLTDDGRKVLEAEVRRLGRAIELAKHHAIGDGS